MSGVASLASGWLNFSLQPRRPHELHMRGCQNDGPFLGTLNIRCRIRIRTQNGTIILTTTHMVDGGSIARTGDSWQQKSPTPCSGCNFREDVPCDCCKIYVIGLHGTCETGSVGYTSSFADFTAARHSLLAGITTPPTQEKLC